MIKNLSIFFFIFILLIASCSKKTSENSSYNEHEDVSLAKVIVKGTLVVGLTNYAPPYYFINSKGEPDGFDVLLLKEVCERLDIDVVFKILDKGNKKQLIESGELDCIAASLSCEPEIAKLYPVTIPIVPSAQVVAVMANTPYETLEDLMGENIAFIEGCPVFDGVKNAEKRKNFKTTKKYNDFLTMISDLRLKAMDAAVVDLLMVSDFMYKQKGVYKILDNAVSADKYVYAFRNSDKILRNTIEEVLIDIEYSGISEELAKKSFGSDICLFGK